LLTSRQNSSRSKYRATPVVIDGIRFKSRLEGDYYAQLKLRKLSGEITHWHREVIVDLGGGVVHRIDWLLFFSYEPKTGIENPWEYVEVKGYDTPAGKAKRRIAESIIGEKITVVKRSGILISRKALTN
jgi:hypothetical protein